MTQNVGTQENKVYKLVLTGGPCGGKTTGQSRLCTFFENLGWKVFRVPEVATVLLSGGIKWTELSHDEAYSFQENLLKTMMQIENTFFKLAESCKKSCIVICDRGTMDASAFLDPDLWHKMKTDNNWNSVDIRDNRYNQIVHMVSAAIGAEEFYTIEDHVVRHEGVEQARELDQKASRGWVGHPYFDVIDNSTDFDTKLRRMITVVCHRLGIDTGDRLATNSRKRKFWISKLPDSEDIFPPFEDFAVVHDYLITQSKRMQARLRRRGQGGAWTYTHTIRRPEISHQIVETKMQITSRDYQYLLAQRDESHYRVYKKRRCFVWMDQYFQMDIYQEPCHVRCEGLILLETFTTKGDDLELPNFLDVKKEVTFDPAYSMYNLSLKDDYIINNKMVKTISEDGV